MRDELLLLLTGARDEDHLPGALLLGTFQQEHQPHLGWDGHGSVWQFSTLQVCN